MQSGARSLTSPTPTPRLSQRARTAAGLRARRIRRHQPTRTLLRRTGTARRPPQDLPGHSLRPRRSSPPPSNQQPTALIHAGDTECTTCAADLCTPA